MRTARVLGGLAVVLASAGAARAESVKYTITVPEVLVRSGPSPEFYPTSKLRQGDTVGVVREEGTGWLAIVPPPGSFSWINTRLVEQNGTKAVVVSAAEAPIWVGSRLINLEPTVWRVKVKSGTQLIVIGRAEASRDGAWVPILPAFAEVRYIRAEEARPGTAPQAVAPAPSAPTKPSSTQSGFASPRPVAPAFAAVTPAPSPTGSASSPAPSSGTNPLWLQAEQAERAGNMAQAQELLEELAQQVKSTDHDLWVRCRNRIQALRERRADAFTAQPPPTRFLAAGNSNNGTATDRFVPTPAVGPAPAPSASTPPQPSRAASEYCYLRDSSYTARLSPPVLTAPTPPPAPSGQWYEPGRLRRTLDMFVDGRPVFCLEPIDRNKRLLYVTAGGNVSLEPYVEKVVYLYGPMVYRGDLRTNYMTVLQVSPVR